MAEPKMLAVVKGGVVVNTVLVPAKAKVAPDGSAASWGDDAFPAPEGCTFQEQADAGIGWTAIDGRLMAPPEPPPPPPPVPAEISDRQFAHGLWRQNVITLAEAKAFVKVGELPLALAELIKLLPAGQRDEADLTISGSTTFRRDHPLTGALSTAFGWTEDVTDEFWRYASKL